VASIGFTTTAQRGTSDAIGLLNSSGDPRRTAPCFRSAGATSGSSRMSALLRQPGDDVVGGPGGRENPIQWLTAKPGTTGCA